MPESPRDWKETLRTLRSWFSFMMSFAALCTGSVERPCIRSVLILAGRTVRALRRSGVQVRTRVEKIKVQTSFNGGSVTLSKGGERFSLTRSSLDPAQQHSPVPPSALHDSCVNNSALTPPPRISPFNLVHISVGGLSLSISVRLHFAPLWLFPPLCSMAAGKAEVA